MKRLVALSTLLASLTIPVFAQHGSGHGGGLSGHTGGSGFGGGMRSGAQARPGFSGARPSAPRPGFQYRPGVSSRPFSYPGMQTTISPYRQAYRSPNEAENRRWNHGGVIYENHRGRRPYGRSYYVAPYYGAYPFGLGYYGLGYYDDSGFDDSSQGYGPDQGYEPGYEPGYDQGQYYSPDQYNGFDPQGNPPEPPPYSIQGQAQGDDEYADPYQADPNQAGRTQSDGHQPGQYPNQVPPGAPYQPYYAPQNLPSGSAQGYLARPAARSAYRQRVPDQTAVVLVFKDGRPNQTIHNYLINGSTLTVWDQSAHDIPVDELNIEATRALNRDKGVDFLLPSR